MMKRKETMTTKLMIMNHHHRTTTVDVYGILRMHRLVHRLATLVFLVLRRPRRWSPMYKNSILIWNEVARRVIIVFLHLLLRSSIFLILPVVVVRRHLLLLLLFRQQHIRPRNYYRSCRRIPPVPSVWTSLPRRTRSFFVQTRSNPIVSIKTVPWSISVRTVTEYRHRVPCVDNPCCCCWTMTTTTAIVVRVVVALLPLPLERNIQCTWWYSK